MAGSESRVRVGVDWILTSSSTDRLELALHLGKRCGSQFSTELLWMQEFPQGWEESVLLSDCHPSTGLKRGVLSQWRQARA